MARRRKFQKKLWRVNTSPPIRITSNISDPIIDFGHRLSRHLLSGLLVKSVNLQFSILIHTFAALLRHKINEIDKKHTHRHRHTRRRVVGLSERSSYAPMARSETIRRCPRFFLQQIVLVHPFSFLVWFFVKSVCSFLTFGRLCGVSRHLGRYSQLLFERPPFCLSSNPSHRFWRCRLDGIFWWGCIVCWTWNQHEFWCPCSLPNGMFSKLRCLDPQSLFLSFYLILVAHSKISV